MAIYVYVTATGALYSYIPDNVTVAQAQASGQLASAAALTASGLTAIGGLSPLSATIQWNPATLTTSTVLSPPSTEAIAAVAATYKANATRRANKLQAKGQLYDAMQILLNLNGSN